MAIVRQKNANVTLSLRFMFYNDKEKKVKMKILFDR